MSESSFLTFLFYYLCAELIIEGTLSWWLDQFVDCNPHQLRYCAKAWCLASFWNCTKYFCDNETLDCLDIFYAWVILHTRHLSTCERNRPTNEKAETINFTSEKYRLSWGRGDTTNSSFTYPVMFFKIVAMDEPGIAILL
jgi:hypothetical protein